MNSILTLRDQVSSEYKPFTDELRELLISQERCADKVLSLIEGEASLAVERLIPQETRSRHGIFFTPEIIASQLASIFESEINSGASFFDPACGAGNLLLGVARQYEIKETLEETVELWAKKFGGHDLNGDFVHASKLRLIFLAAYRHGLPDISEQRLNELTERFNNFTVGDYLSSCVGADFDCIVANPPFGHVIADEACTWSSGKTQLAAVFMDRLLDLAKTGQKIVAVLPDVLRSGTRYRRWRGFFETRSSHARVIPYGRFASNVDVDVFLLQATRTRAEGGSEIEWVPKLCSNGSRSKVSDYYQVRVGPVVPFRLDGKGDRLQYINAKNCPAYGEVSKATTIRFSGTQYTPPFVAIRRTSNPSDKNRLVTTLVTCKGSVAVENHLIIAIPKDGTLDSCKFLMDRLADYDSVVQLNGKIRCRHLTTKSIMDIDI